MKIPTWFKSGAVWMKGLLAAVCGGTASSVGTVAMQQMNNGSMPDSSAIQGAAIAGAIGGFALYLMNPPKQKVEVTQAVSTLVVPPPMTQEQIDAEIKRQVAEQVAKAQGK